MTLGPNHDNPNDSTPVGSAFGFIISIENARWLDGKGARGSHPLLVVVIPAIIHSGIHHSVCGFTAGRPSQMVHSERK